MLKYFFFAVYSLLGVCHAQSPRFQHLYGNSQVDWIYAVDTITNGCLLAGGSTKSYGQGDYDGCILRADSFGNVLGLVTLGGALEDAVFDFVTLPSNRHLVAGFSKSVGINTPVPNGFLCLIEDNGNVLWQNAVGGNNADGLRSIIRPAQGKYFYSCGFTASQGLGGEDGWIIKGDTLGNILWQITLGTLNNERCQKLVETADGNLAAIVNMDTGAYVNFGLVKLDTAGNVLWQKIFNGPLMDMAYSIISTADSGFAIAAGGYSYGAGSQDVYLIKLNSLGQTQWFKTYGDTYDDIVCDLVEYTDDQGVPRNYFLTGYSPGLESDTSATWGNYKGFVLCTDASGVMQWVNMYGQGPSDYFLTMQLLGNNDLLLAGYGTGSPWGGADMWMVRTSFLGWSGCNQFAVSTTQTSPTDPTYTTLNRTVANLPVSASNLVSQLVMPLSYTICTNNPTVSNQDLFPYDPSPGFYPNPTSGIIHFRDLNSSSLQYALYDRLGKCVEKEQATSSIELASSLPNGIYFLEVLSGEHRHRHKVILDR